MKKEKKIVSNSSGERTKDTPSFKIQFPSIVHCLPRIFSAKWKFIISSHFKIEKTISSAWLPVEGGAELLIKHTDWEEVCLIVRLFANSMEIIQHSFFARKLHRCFAAAPRLLCIMWELCSVWRIYDSQTANSQLSLNIWCGGGLKTWNSFKKPSQNELWVRVWKLAFEDLDGEFGAEKSSSSKEEERWIDFIEMRVRADGDEEDWEMTFWYRMYEYLILMNILSVSHFIISGGVNVMTFANIIIFPLK